MFRIAVLDDYQQVALAMADWTVLAGRAEVVPFTDHLDDEDQLVARLAQFDAVVLMRERTPMPARVLERLPQLRLIATSGAANAALDVDAARRVGITVCGTTGWAGVTATVELTWGLILAVSRQIPREDAAIRAGRWQVGVGTTLQGTVLGIVGLGNIGPLLVPVARAFGMDVVAWSRNLTDARAAEVGVRRLDHDAFFAASDVVTVHLKLSDRSRGYIGRDELRAMKPTARLVNTSRGPVVDEAALVDALEQGWIVGAALDVFDPEPLPPGHPLLTAPNTVLTPHIGYVSHESYRQYFPQIVEDIDAYLRGAPIRVL
ncbi:MAG TPA: D-2-hydroxyacid dehydrogenase family protein [Acidimicrobiales bacterium]|nr:D-2-hydroxyacid dehydrogenase family protein [Acidimicrobiales bacterium]